MTEIERIKLADGYEEEVCAKCGSSVDWEDCPDCEDGLSYHDCGEDCCCCLDPEPNVVCDTCNGKGGWWICLSCDSKAKKKEGEI